MRVSLESGRQTLRDRGSSSGDSVPFAILRTLLRLLLEMLPRSLLLRPSVWRLSRHRDAEPASLLPVPCRRAPSLPFAVRGLLGH